MVFSSSAVWAATRSTGNLSDPNYIQTSFHSLDMLKKQMMWIFLGMVSLFVFYSIDYEFLTKRYKEICLVCLILLVLVLIPGIGIKANGAQRWLGYGPIRFQPSEFAKLAVIFFMSRYLYENKEHIRSFKKVFLPTALVMTVFLVLVVAERDFGTTVVILAICFSVWFMAGVPIRYLALSTVLSLPVLVGLVMMKSYRIDRILVFLNPGADPTNKGWQLNQSLITMGSGGTFGKGLGEGMQKYRFLSEAHTDFIFAMIGEEMGIVGTIATVIVFFALVAVCLWVAYRTLDFQGATLAGGIAMMIGIPAFIHMGVVTGLLPPKGLALPFVSYGGSAMLINLSAIGIVMNIARSTDKATAESNSFQRRRPKRKKQKVEATPIWVKG